MTSHSPFLQYQESRFAYSGNERTLAAIYHQNVVGILVRTDVYKNKKDLGL
jgi:hypothetical protein